MIRIIDFILSLTGTFVLLPVLLIVTLFGFFDTGSPFFFQKRVGRHKRPFTLIKFRTMNKDTASVASHLARTSDVTKLGKFLRATKLDELPQLINVLTGDMSLVGPRPNLFNQEDLIRERDKLNVYSIRPGITGISQIKNVDMSTPQKLAALDATLLESLTVKAYFSFIFKTILGSGRGDAIK